MATVEKQSLRNEVGRLEAEFNQLVEQGKISPEARALFQGLMTLFELIMAIFLEKNTKKTKKNSGKPSSQTDKDDSALGQSGSKGKGKKQSSSQAANTRTVTKTTTIKVNTCEHCGESLENVFCRCHERRTRIDIVFEKTVEHFDAEIKQCPYCHGQTKGQYPADLHSKVQYGPGIKAYAIDLLTAQMVSVNRVQKMLKTLIGVNISEATLLKYVMSLHGKLKQWEQSTKEQLLQRPALHVDETSLRVSGKNQWIHSYSAGKLTLKYLHSQRGKEAMNAINIIPRYGGVLIHDCWSAYLSYQHCKHALCGSHLLRELAFVVDSNGYRWAKNIKELLKATCHEVSKSKEKCLNLKAYTRLRRRYRNLLTRAQSELPEVPRKPNGKRGPIAKSEAHNLWERLKRYETAVLLFAQNPHVAFTNNRAEQDLRMSKVKQKVSGCFRQERYAQAYCRVSSYLQTMANCGINPMIAVQTALSGEIYNQTGE